MEGGSGQKASNRLAYGMGLLLLMGLAAATIAVMRTPRPAIPKVMVGTQDAVYYSRAATREEAAALGEALHKMGFFRDQGSSVMVSKSKSGTAVSFVAGEGTWDRADSAAAFEEMGRRVAPLLGGFPIEVRLVDAGWHVRKSLEVGKAVIGTRDEIYYLGSATESDARALGEALRNAGYLADRGASVTVSKGDGTAIGFVVSEGVWERADAVAAFARLARQVAPSLGGPPLEVRLLSPQMEPRKEIVVQ